MYQLVYYVKTTEGLASKEQEFNKYEGAKFRLRRNALRFVREIEQCEYRIKGFATEEIVGGISCYKSEKTECGDRKITEIIVKVEKA